MAWARGAKEFDLEVLLFEGALIEDMRAPESRRLFALVVLQKCHDDHPMHHHWRWSLIPSGEVWQLVLYPCLRLELVSGLVSDPYLPQNRLPVSQQCAVGILYLQYVQEIFLLGIHA